MDTYDMEDLIAFYPDPDTLGIQKLISAKKEFRDLASSVTEPVPKRGEYFKHQQWVRRFMIPYDRLLMIHRTGTGKTCAMVAIAEHFKKLYFKDPENAPIRRVIVLLKGPSLKNEFKNQLVYKCTAGDYETEMVKNATDERLRKSNITREVKKWYTIKTYAKFVNNILKEKMTDEEIRYNYSDTLFFVDEVHNIRYEEEKDLKNLPPIVDGEDLENIFDKEESVYSTLKRVFEVVKRSKVVLATATPMINLPSEIGPVMNLILPENEKMSSSLNYDNPTIEEFEKYFRGKISYVRELDTGAIPREIGDVLDYTHELGEGEGEERIKSQATIFFSEMSKKQEEAYIIEKERDASSFSAGLRQLSCFVFPDGSYGGNPSSPGSPAYSGLGRYVSVESGDVYKALPNFINEIKGENLKKYSPKFYNVIKLVKESKNNAFCYTEFVSGCGAILLGVCFQHNNFDRFFGSVGQEIGNLTKRLRYALITRDTTEASLNRILTVFNSYENRYGEYIKVIIGSPVSRDGINLSNVTQGHLITPAWHQSGMYQALSRFIRSTSHVVLIEEERKKLISEGKDPDTAKINVDVYKHSSITSDGESIENSLYLSSENKDIRIKRMERIMKQCAVDCQIHRERNVRITDKDGSPICDYKECNFKCVDDFPLEEDLSTYQVFYKDEIIGVLVEKIIYFFKDKIYIPLKDIYNLLSSFKKIFIDFALEELISRKTPIYNKYGFISYLNIKNDIVYLQRELPLIGEYDRTSLTSHLSGDYTKSLIYRETKSIEEIIVEMQNSRVETTNETSSVFEDFSQFEQTFESLPSVQKIKFLEDVFIDVYSKNDQEKMNVLSNLFNSAIFQFYEPIEEIEEAIGILTEIKKGQRGRNLNPNIPKPKLLGPDKIVNQSPENGIVFVHILKELNKGNANYSISSLQTKDFIEIRIFKPKEKTEENEFKWRDITLYELPAYNILIKERMNEIFEKYERYDIYGTLLNERFRIRDKTTEVGETEDKRTRNRGKVCVDWSVADLIRIIEKEKIKPPETYQEVLSKIEKNVTNKISTEENSQENIKEKIKEEIYNVLIHHRIEESIDILKTLSLEDLLNKYYWANYTDKRKMCEAIKNNLRKKGKLMERKKYFSF